MTDSLPVRLHPLAEDDASAAYSWYLERNPIVAEIFFAELNSALDRIAQNPRRWPRMGGRYRRYLLGRFPYSVVYQERPQHIEVVAVAHLELVSAWIDRLYGPETVRAVRLHERLEQVLQELSKELPPYDWRIKGTEEHCQ